MDYSGAVAVILIFVLGLIVIWIAHYGIKIIFRSREQERWCKIFECLFGIAFLTLAVALSFLTYLVAVKMFSPS